MSAEDRLYAHYSRKSAPVIPVGSEAENYCHACGEYMPMNLAETARVHDCERTPPLDGLPPNIYACPACGGHARSRYGCWGTADHPHPHAFMQPLHEIVRGQGTGHERVIPATDLIAGLREWIAAAPRFTAYTARRAADSGQTHEAVLLSDLSTWLDEHTAKAPPCECNENPDPEIRSLVKDDGTCAGCGRRAKAPSA